MPTIDSVMMRRTPAAAPADCSVRATEPKKATYSSGLFATIDVASIDGIVFARGMVSDDAATVRAAAGHRTSDLPAGVAREVIHRDDLVLLPT